MKTKLLPVLCSLLSLPAAIDAQTTAFTYQGRLADGGAPATGNYDLQFAVFSAPTGGSPVAGPLTNAPTAVSNGLFTVTLDFGAAPFTGADLWLEIGVRTSGSVAAHTPLVTRQALTPTPYAIYARGANAVGITGTVPDSRLSANVALRAGGNAFTGHQTVMSGNVGIGTTAPSGQLEITSAGGEANLHVNGINGSTPVIRLMKEGILKWGWLASAEQMGFHSYDANTPVMVLDIRANVGIGTTAPEERLHVGGNIRASGSICANNGVNCVSDRNAKREFAPVNSRDVLEKVAALPLSTWSYITDPNVRHLGPTAQDFRTAFAVGKDEKSIATVDADGVALAAIQGLNQKVEDASQRSEDRIQKLEAENAELKQSVAELRELVGKLAAKSNGGAR